MTLFTIAGWAPSTKMVEASLAMRPLRSPPPTPALFSSVLSAMRTFAWCGDMLPSSAYADRLKRVPPAWQKAFEVNASSDPAVRASCVEFVLAGLYASDRISRAQRHGRIVYET